MAQKTTAVPEALLHFDSFPDSAEVRAPIVRALFGISDATLWRWSRNGCLPKPRKRGPKVTCWNVGELRACLLASVPSAAK